MRTPLRSDASRAALLPATRDCLVNVDVSGMPVPSSRFMGGREIEILAGRDAQATASESGSSRLSCAIAAVEAGEMVLPARVAGVGPFPTAMSRNLAAEPNTHCRMALAHLYAAMLADVSLDLIGSHDTLLIDGRFATAPVFVQALANLRPTTQVLISSDDNGVAHGALRLASVTHTDSFVLQRVPPLAVDMSGYRARWLEAAERAG
jgi:hypothetical protein